MINSKSIVNRIYSFIEPLFKEPKKHLKTWLVVIIFLTSIWSVVFFLNRPEPAQASWWNETWLYRKAVNISNDNGENLTDFQVAVTLDTASLITDGKMQDSCNDIRITDINGKMLPHFLDSVPGCNNESTVIWTKIPEIPTEGKTIYVYYGNPSASNQNNGEEVLESGGIWLTNWYDGHASQPINESEMDTLFSAVSYSDRGGWGPRSQIDCNNNACNIYGTDSNYLTLLEGWIYAPESGTYGFATDSDDASDVHINGANWKDNVGGTNVVSWYGGHGTSGNWTHNGTISLNAGFHRYVYRHEEVSGGDDWLAGWQKPSDTSYTLIPTENFYYRKHIDNEPVVDTTLSEEISPGPVAYWKFDEGEGTTAHDSSGQGNDGTINGATWQTEDMCISGKCLEFDGTNNIEIPNPLHQDNLNQEWTVKAWIKLANNVEIGTQYLISSFNLGLRLNHHSANKPLLYLNSGIDDYYIYGTQDLKDNNWHHVTFIFRNSDGLRKIYIDGKDDSSSGPNHTSTPAGISDTIYLGTGTIGFIDEIKIYPYARTEEQIKSDYVARASSKGSGAVFGHKAETAQITPIASKLVAHWKFDEGYGSTAHDHIGGNHGTLSGTTVPEWTNEGKVGKALIFDGIDSYLTADLNVSPSETTVSFWLKNASYGAGPYLFRSNANTRTYIGVNSSNNLYFTKGSPSTSIASISNPTTNSWTHVLLKWWSDSGSLYGQAFINGKPINDPVFFEGTANGSYITVGGFSSTGGQNAAGFIDEVKIYNAALTQEEILQDYNQGMAAVMGQSSTNTGSTAPGGSAAQEYCVPGSNDTCRPPVAEWKFDEKTGDTAYDTSGNNNEGTLVNNPTWRSTAFCKEGGCLEFNGSNYVSKNNFSGLTGKSGATIEFFARPTTLAEGSYAFWADSNTLIEIGCSSTFSCDENDARVRWHLDGAWRNSHIATDSVEQNQWDHWVFLFDSGNTKIYKNGVEIYSGSDSQTSITSSNSDYYIGYREEGYNNFNGLIDQILIYDYARTPAQIAWDYNRGKPVGHWRFDECQGTTAYDVSGNGNHGTINIGATAPQTSVGTCASENSAHAWYNGREGKWGASLSFDGMDDYVAITDNNLLDANSNTGFSAFAWVKFFDIPSSGYQHIINKGWSTTEGYFLRLYNLQKKIQVKIEDNNGNVISDDQSGLSSNTNIDTNRWYHLGLTFNGTETKLYLDGRVDNSSTDEDIGDATNSLPVKFGVAQGNSAPVNGLIDDVRIYNYALTPLQIKTLYNDGAVRFGD
ncbi:MAG: DUF2341 domain-containing protein [Patescibacteria group bacterium]|jgi:hypothetical protein